MLDVERIVRELQGPAAAPLHRRLHDAILAQLIEGTLQPGETLPPERALQDQLGVSRSTVRQALRSLVDAGMLQSVVGAGTYVLDRRARRHARDLVGIIVPDSRFFIYYDELVPALSARLREAGYRVDLSIYNDQPDTLQGIAAGLLRQGVAAVVMTALEGQRTDAVIRELRAGGVPVMLMARYLDQFESVDYVGADNRRIGYDATRHLIELGHRAIVHIAGTGSSTAHDRAFGYRDAMAQVGLEPQIYVLEPEQPLEPAELQPYLLEPDPAQLWARIVRREITAAFCFNDMAASWLQKEIRNRNLIVPRDLALVGVDNLPYADFFDAPLTTFALPGLAIGQRSADLLLRRLAGEGFPPQRVLLPARFIQRLSTAPPRQPVPGS